MSKAQLEAQLRNLRNYGSCGLRWQIIYSFSVKNRKKCGICNMLCNFNKLRKLGCALTWYENAFPQLQNCAALQLNQKVHCGSCAAFQKLQKLNGAFGAALLLAEKIVSLCCAALLI